MRLSAWIVVACWLKVSVRCTEYLENSTGTCRSPNYPNQYGNYRSKDCRITVRPGFRIKVIFTSFDVGDYDASQGRCYHDFVDISDASGLIDRFCGNSYLHSANAPRMNQWVYSKNNTMRIRFKSGGTNKKIESTGFSAEYAETDIDECAIQRRKKYVATEDWYELMTCNHLCINTLGSYRCSCRRGFQLHQNSHTCVAKFCENQVLTDLEGDIMSPDYPASYAKLSSCAWDIKVPTGFFINLIFSQYFDIEKHVDLGCVYDILTIRYNTSSDRFCGRTAPLNGSIWYLNTNESRIEFTTDFSAEKMGFKLHYNTTRIKCLKHPRAPEHGSIPTNYKGFYEFEDNVTFSCNRGYEIPIENSSVIFCQSNGEWDFKEPICKIKSCGKPEHLMAVKYSSIENFDSKVFTYLEIVRVICDEWYEQRSGYSTWRCEDSKNWTVHFEYTNGGVSNSSDSALPICRPKCGKRLVDDDPFATHSSNGKIVKRDGGWPWMAFIDLGGGRNGEDYCGGALIDEETVVTAAHCLEDVDPFSNVSVWLGLRKRKTDNYNFTQKFVVPENQRHIYERFKVVSDGEYHYYEGDIAILKLSPPANLSFYVRPICIPYGGKADSLKKYFQKAGENAIVTGWGKTDDGDFSDTLMKVRLGIVNSTICQENYQNEFNGAITITSNMTCAGYEYGNIQKVVSDTCRGDSGGPLMMKTGNHKSSTWYLSGVVSFGDERDGCGHSRTYGVYTDVSKFENFIQIYLQ